VRGSEIARRFASPMLSRIANKKEAEHASNAVLLSLARLKVSRAAGLAPVARAAGSGKFGLALNGYPGGGVRRAQRASSQSDGEKEPEGVPFGEYAARCPVDGQLPGHQVGAWVVSEGG
jgi:hypothetical protein